MSRVYNYSKELVSITADPNERTAAIKVRRAITTVRRVEPRTSIAKDEPSITVPVSYLVRSKVRNLMEK